LKNGETVAEVLKRGIAYIVGRDCLLVIVEREESKRGVGENGREQRDFPGPVIPWPKTYLGTQRIGPIK